VLALEGSSCRGFGGGSGYCCYFMVCVNCKYSMINF